MEKEKIKRQRIAFYVQSNILSPFIESCTEQGLTMSEALRNLIKFWNSTKQKDFFKW